LDFRLCRGHVPPIRDQMRQHQQQSELRYRQYKSQHPLATNAPRSSQLGKRSTPVSRRVHDVSIELIYPYGDDGYENVKGVKNVIPQQDDAAGDTTSYVDNCTNDTTIISTLLDGYNKHKLPDSNGVNVKVEFWIQEISSVSEISNDFEMDIYINEM